MVAGIALLYSSAVFSQPTITNPLLGQQATSIASAYGPRTEYSITRKGRNIGSHVLSFSVSGSELQVSIESSIKVRILGIPVYSLIYRASEVWKENQLGSAMAQTIENGKSNTVNFERNGSNSADFASNHWHPGVLVSDKVFNTLTGETDDVTITPIGAETIEINGQKVDSFRYRYSYEQPVDSWYDSRGLWLKLQFSGEDGSVVRYMREN